MPMHRSNSNPITNYEKENESLRPNNLEKLHHALLTVKGVQGSDDAGDKYAIVCLHYLILVLRNVRNTGTVKLPA